MPRRPPSTEIEARGELIRPAEISPRCAGGPPHFPAKRPAYDFTEALDILGCTNLRNKSRREKELACICLLFEMEFRAEKHDTAAGKKEAYQRAIKGDRRRRRAVECIQSAFPLDSILGEVLKKLPAYMNTWPYRGKIERKIACLIAERLKEKGIELKARQRVAAATRVLREKNRLPQSLEQEVARLQSHRPRLSREQCIVKLRDKYGREFSLGRKESNALRNMVHALQAFATSLDSTLIRRNGEIPEGLIRFIQAVVSAAKIKCGPSYIASPSRFRRLLLGTLAPKTFTVVGPSSQLPQGR